jgi:hypothetical protein
VPDLRNYWKNLPDTSTPFEASVLNNWGGDVEDVRDEAVAARNAAQAAAEAAAAPADDQIAALLTQTDSASRVVLDSIYGLVVSVRDPRFGAVGDGITVDGPAIQAAVDYVGSVGGGVVYFPKGTYLIDGPITVTASNTSLVGSGRTVTRLLSSVTTGNMIEIALSATRATVASMTIDRQTIATAGAGIYAYSATGIGNHMDFRDLYVYRQFRGMYLGPQSWGEIRNVIVDVSSGDGIFITNNTENGACQWQLTNVLVQKAGGHAFWVYSQATGPTQITLGQWTNVASFACTGSGIYLQGRTGRPIHDARITGAFIGEDGCTAGAEIVLDTFGGSHLLTGIFVELAGSRTTGPTLATAASGTGHGIYATANNTDWTMAGAHIVANARSGIYNEAARATITGLTAKNNGTNATAGPADNSGVYWAAGRGVLYGQAWSQDTGVYGAVATLFGLVDCTGSTTGYAGVTRSASLVIV